MAKTKMKTVDMSIDPDATDEKTKKVLEAETGESDGEAKKAEKPVQKKVRSQKYQASRRHVDRTRTYELKRAVELLKQTSYTSFTGTVSVDGIVKDEKLSLEVGFPHSTGKQIRVAIADDDTLAKVEKGQIDFDVLVADPKMMPKIAKFARVLGPKGLMPNPKNGTVSPDPAKRAKELAAGKTQIRTEKKAPLIHVIVGKTSMDDAELVANIESLIKAVGAKKLVKLTLSATMSPGIKIDLSGYQAA